PMVQGAVLVTVALFIMATIISDLVVAWLDPRVRAALLSRRRRAGPPRARGLRHAVPAAPAARPAGPAWADTSRTGCLLRAVRRLDHALPALQDQRAGQTLAALRRARHWHRQSGPRRLQPHHQG